MDDFVACNVSETHHPSPGVLVHYILLLPAWSGFQMRPHRAQVLQSFLELLLARSWRPVHLWRCWSSWSAEAKGEHGSVMGDVFY